MCLLALLAIACGTQEVEPTDIVAAPTSAPAPAPAASSSAPAEPPPSAVPVDCQASSEITLFTSPRAPAPGAPLRVMALTEQRGVTGELSVVGPAGGVAKSDTRRGGPIYFWNTQLDAAPAGTHRVAFRAPGVHVCATVEVGAEVPARATGRWGQVWATEAAWDRATEAYFSAWLELLFDAPIDEQLAWPALHEVLRDPARNFLFEHLGLGEDDPAQRPPALDPDCADLPYFLRAYFAFKLGLPFGYSRCTRGTSKGPPECLRFFDNERGDKGLGEHPVRRLGNFLRVTVADTVHSGSPRTAGDADATDFYPVKLKDESALRPGTIFADPYGHILIVVRRIAQEPGKGGVLLAVDGQPDGTVSRRRFWRGNFLFSDDTTRGGPGFKRYRPVVRDGETLRQLRNEEIAASPIYGDYGLDQYEGGIDGFYDLVDDVLSPEPLDPKTALLETIQALDEQVRGRVLSVQNGVDYRRKGGMIDMPAARDLFQTQGPWEDFSTPSRDMRLLIAMDVVTGLPALVERRPQRYRMPEGKAPADLVGELRALLEAEAQRRTFSYERSDGSKHELTLADVLARAPAFEMAYNPNDCPEKRWGAVPGSDEHATCSRTAPAGQRSQMETYRPWFVHRRRP